LLLLLCCSNSINSNSINSNSISSSNRWLKVRYGDGDDTTTPITSNKPIPIVTNNNNNDDSTISSVSTTTTDDDHDGGGVIVDDDGDDDDQEEEEEESKEDDSSSISPTDDSDSSGSSNSDDTTNSQVVAEIKQIWKRFFAAAPTSDQIYNTINEPTALRPNGTDQYSLYRQILSQFIDPTITQKRALWMDQEFALNLKGIGVLAQHPNIIPNGMSRIIRGVRLVSSTGGTSIVQHTIAKALAHSLAANTVFLTRKTVDSVHQQAVAKKLPKNMLNRANLISILFDLMEDMKEPSIVTLNDDINWIIRSEANSDAILEEMKSSKSKVLFLLLENEEALEPGQTLLSMRQSRVKEDEKTNQNANGNNPEQS
jgi:hypothetical protein